MRTKTYLNGKWKFVPMYDQKPTNNHNVTECDIPLYAHEKLIRSGWQTVTVPGVWQRYAEKYSVYEGVCWFYREFDIGELENNESAYLVFKGVNYRADVYINSQYVGFHESAYTEFSFDISGFLRSGKNSLAVCVDNRPTEVKWPNDWGYGVYGGIHRDVYIERFAGEYVKNVRTIPDYDVEKRKGILHITADACGVEYVTVRIGENETAVPVINGKINADIVCNADAWTLESPVLYPVEIWADGDVYYSQKIGFRNISCKNKRFYLNGTETRFKGACYLCDSPESGLAMSREEIRRDLEMMKAANINAIRTHYPMGDDFYELCDEMGFMLWIEPNIYCSKPHDDEVNTVFKQQVFVDTAVSMTEEMVLAAVPYASVVIFGIGNECNTSHPEARVFFEKIADTVRKCDTTRLIGYASLYGHVGNIGHLVDIMGINSYFGWYGTFDIFEIEDKRPVVDGKAEIRSADVSQIHTLIRDTEALVSEDVPLLLTEFGADSLPGYTSSVCELWSENYHAEVVSEYIKAAQEHSGVAGTFVFAFTDYNDPSKPLNGRWNGLNLKGMLSYEREIKLPYYALKKAYSKN